MGHLSCATAIALGTASGGWRIIKTLGSKIYRLRPVHAFCAQTASATVILGAALLGGPVSTTHVVSSSIMGVGAGQRISAVRWGVAKNIIVAWFITIPASGLISGLTFLLFRALHPRFDGERRNSWHSDLERKNHFPTAQIVSSISSCRQSAKTVEGLEALWVFAENGNRENANLVRNIEREADELRRILIEELDRTFVTPIDREDIFALSRAIDDVVDYANTTVDEMEIYEVKGDAHIQEMVNILRKAARELNDAVKILKDYPKIASEHALKAKAYENTIEKAYHMALADLFKGSDTSIC